MSITGDESSLSYALPPPAPPHWLLEQLGCILIHWWSHAIFESNFCLWILLSSLLWVIEVSTKVEDLTLFTRREKTTNKQTKSIMEFLLNNSRAKPSTSSFSLDPIKNPMNSVCIIIFIVGGTKLCLRSSQPYIPLLLRTNNCNHWILSRNWLHFIWLHFVQTHWEG